MSTENVYAIRQVRSGTIHLRPSALVVHRNGRDIAETLCGNVVTGIPLLQGPDDLVTCEACLAAAQPGEHDG